jgi:HEAT repeat protein
MSPFGLGKPDIEKMKAKGNIRGLIKALDYKNESKIRVRAAEALGQIADISAVDALIVALKDSDEAMRNSVAEALGAIGDTKSVDALSSAGAVNGLVVALKNSKSSAGAINGLVVALKNSKSEVRLSAVVALSNLDPATYAGVENALVVALKDSDPIVRKKGAVALADMNPVYSAKDINSLLVALEDSESDVRANAARALGKIGKDRPIDRTTIVGGLLIALKDSDSNVRFYAAFALGLIGHDNAVGDLLSALKDHDWQVRKEAALALGKIGNAQAVDALFDAAKDTLDVSVYPSAVAALGDINESKAVDALTLLLNYEPSLVNYKNLREEAAKALACKRNPKAIKALRAYKEERLKEARAERSKKAKEERSKKAIEAKSQKMNVMLKKRGLSDMKCSKCDKPLEFMGQFGGIFSSTTSVRGAGNASDFDMWRAQVCTRCSYVFCDDCLELGRPTPCPKCGTPTAPAYRGTLKTMGDS